MKRVSNPKPKHIISNSGQGMGSQGSTAEAGDQDRMPNCLLGELRIISVVVQLSKIKYLYVSGRDTQSRKINGFMLGSPAKHWPLCVPVGNALCPMRNLHPLDTLICRQPSLRRCAFPRSPDKGRPAPTCLWYTAVCLSLNLQSKGFCKNHDSRTCLA